MAGSSFNTGPCLPPHCWTPSEMVWVTHPKLDDTKSPGENLSFLLSTTLVCKRGINLFTTDFTMIHNSKTHLATCVPIMVIPRGRCEV